MDKLELKKSLLEICTSLQQKRMDIVQNAMKDAQQSANEYGPPKDRYDSYRMQLLRKKDMLGQQYQKVNAEMMAINKISLVKPLQKVEFGAVVITDDQNIFISIGLGKFEMGKDTYFAISPNVPLYEAMKGLKNGDTFSFMGKTKKILDLF